VKNKILAAAVLAVAIGLAVYFLLRPEPPLNVIVISIDTLRPDRMGAYGHRAGETGEGTTPFLDELASKGALFTNAVSTSSWTLPAHYALLTGMPDELHDMVHDSMPPSPKIAMLAEILGREGYATGGFYSGPYLHPFFGFARGFDRYESCLGFRTIYDVPKEEIGTWSQTEIRQSLAETEAFSHEAVTSREVTEKGLSFVREKGDRPFFLFLHYFDVHNDYVPPAPFNKLFDPGYTGWVDGRGVTRDPRYKSNMTPRDLENLLARYDGEIAWVDDNIRRLFSGIRKIDPKILENSIVIVTSDHGEAFLEHGEIGHRHSLYEEEVKIPLIVSSPGRIEDGARIDEAVTIYDIVPTLLDMLDLDGPHGMFGRSFLPRLEGKGTPSAGGTARPLPLELTVLPRGEDKSAFFKHLALRLGDLKLISVQKREWSPERPLDFTGSLIEEKHELFDLKQDGGEGRDIAGQRRDLLERMLETRGELFRELKAEYEKIRRSGGTLPQEIPDSIREKLKALGYDR